MKPVFYSLLALTFLSAPSFAAENLCDDPSALVARAEKDPYLGKAIATVDSKLTSDDEGYVASEPKCEQRTITTDGDADYTVTLTYERSGNSPLDRLVLEFVASYFNGDFSVKVVDLSAPAWAQKAPSPYGLNARMISYEPTKVRVASELGQDTTIIAGFARTWEASFVSEQPLLKQRFLDVRVTSKDGLENGWVVEKTFGNADLDRRRNSVSLIRTAYNFGDRPVKKDAYSGDVYKIRLLNTYSGPYAGGN